MKTVPLSVSFCSLCFTIRSWLTTGSHGILMEYCFWAMFVNLCYSPALEACLWILWRLLINLNGWKQKMQLQHLWTLLTNQDWASLVNLINNRLQSVMPLGKSNMSNAFFLAFMDKCWSSAEMWNKSDDLTCLLLKKQGNNVLSFKRTGFEAGLYSVRLKVKVCVTCQKQDNLQPCTSDQFLMWGCWRK